MAKQTHECKQGAGARYTRDVVEELLLLAIHFHLERHVVPKACGDHHLLLASSRVRKPRELGWNHGIGCLRHVHDSLCC